MSMLDDLVAKVEVKFNEKHKEILAGLKGLKEEHVATNARLTAIENEIKAIKGKLP